MQVKKSGENMKYAVNENGIAIMRDAATLIVEIINDFKTAVDSVRSASNDYSDTLGPHVNELNEALDSISDSIMKSAEPTNNIAQTLRSVAEAYEEIISETLFGVSYSDADGGDDGSPKSIGAKVLRR